MSVLAPVALGRVGLFGLIVLPFGAGYFLSYFLRNLNAVLAPQIVDELGLSASEIGLLTSVYFLAAALVLIPMAVSLDRFGPRKLLLAEIGLAGTGCAVFALGQSLEMLVLGRALIGVGVAGSLTTAFKAITLWFPRRLWATGNAYVLGVGSLGVILGTQPLQWALNWLDWREVFWLGAALAALVVAVGLLFVPEREAPTRTVRMSSREIYGQVLGLRVFWRMMPAAALPMAVYFAIQGLWANGWMQDVAGLTQAEIGSRLLAMALGVTVGMLANGAIGDALGRLGVPLAAVIAVGLGLLFLAQAIMILEAAPRAYWPWVVMGFTGNIGALGYPLLSRRFPAYAAARAMSALAISIFVLAFATQYAMGLVLDLWTPDAQGRYPAEAYRAALSGFLALELACFAWFLTGREVWAPLPAPVED